jgi:hypothetical protein
MKTDLEGVLEKALNASDCYTKLHRDYRIITHIDTRKKGKSARERIVNRVYEFANLYKSFYDFVRKVGKNREFEKEEKKAEMEMKELIEYLAKRGFKELSYVLQRTDLEVTFPEGVSYG